MKCSAATKSQIENVGGANIDLNALTEDQLEKIATGRHYRLGTTQMSGLKGALHHAGGPLFSCLVPCPHVVGL
jgi:hypothetical protein